MDSSANTGGKTVQVVVVTPERTVLDAVVDFVSIPIYDGELGVLPGRAPLIGKLGPGELRTRKGTHVERYYIDGGFAQVRANVVTVLTPRAVKGEDINAQAVTQSLQARATSEAQLKVQERARVQLRISKRAHEEKPAISLPH